ncbi:MAG: tyrosine-type recombinase/integrase [Verrucomicrobiota bacterium]
MSTCLFRSPLAFRLQAFWETNRSVGNKSAHCFKILRRLDEFLLCELKPGETITRELAERWFKGMAHLSPGTRINRMGILRRLCLYLSHFDPRTCFVHRAWQPRRNRPMPYIYSRDEVRRIMAAAETLPDGDGLRRLVFSTLVGLLYATGVRIGEALGMRLGHVDLKRRLIRVQETKFKKSRYVPLAPSVAAQLAHYLRRRRAAGYSQAADAHFFVSRSGGYYHPVTFVTTFLAVLRQLGLRGPAPQRGPRIHDLRHSFAVSRLLAWHRSGANLYAKLPTLSTYLGHVTVTGTELYLHATAELLESTGQRFHDRFAVPQGRKHHARHR